MMASQITPTGMVTYSATNPLDQIPVGPQVFPFGAPTVDQSLVEPYQASVYSPGIKSSQMQIPDSTYQSVGDASNYMTQVQAADSLPAANYDASALAPQYQTPVAPQYQMPVAPQYQMPEALPPVNYDPTAMAADALPMANYDASALAAQYQGGAEALSTVGAQQGAYASAAAAEALPQAPAGYEYRTVLKPVVKTTYQKVTKLKPVVKTSYVPQTKYVPRVVNSGVQGVSTLDQQSLALSQTAPLSSSVQSSVMNVAPQPMEAPIPLTADYASQAAPLSVPMQPLSVPTTAMPMTADMTQVAPLAAPMEPLAVAAPSMPLATDYASQVAPLTAPAMPLTAPSMPLTAPAMPLATQPLAVSAPLTADMTQVTPLAAPMQPLAVAAPSMTLATDYASQAASLTAPALSLSSQPLAVTTPLTNVLTSSANPSLSALVPLSVSGVIQ